MEARCNDLAFIYVRLLQHIELANILVEQQFSFRPASTDMASLSVED
jgi:hypothetical protein